MKRKAVRDGEVQPRRSLSHTAAPTATTVTGGASRMQIHGPLFAGLLPGGAGGRYDGGALSRQEEVGRHKDDGLSDPTKYPALCAHRARPAAWREVLHRLARGRRQVSASGLQQRSVART